MKQWLWHHNNLMMSFHPSVSPCLLADRGRQLLGPATIKISRSNSSPFSILCLTSYHIIILPSHHTIILPCHHLMICMLITCDMWGGAHERWERGVGGRIDEAQDSPDNCVDDGDEVVLMMKEIMVMRCKNLLRMIMREMMRLTVLMKHYLNIWNILRQMLMHRNNWTS